MKTEERKLFLFTPVWGKNYAKRFVYFTLPSLLNKDNIEIFNKDFNTCFIIYTDVETHKILISLLNNIKIFNTLKFKFDTQTIQFEIGKNSKYSVMDLAVKHALKYCSNENALFLWIMPDLIYSENSIKSILKSYLEGAKIVFTPYGFRCHSNLLRKNIKNLSSFKSIREIIQTGIKPARLVSCGLNSIDEKSQIYFSDNYNAYRFPSHILFRSEGCLVYKGFALVATFFDTKYLNIAFDIEDYNSKYTSLESSDLLDVIAKDSQIGVLESSEDYFAVALETHLPSVIYRDSNFAADGFNKSNLNYYLISLFSNTPNLSKLNCNLFSKNIFYYTSEEHITISKNLLNELDFANKRVSYWINFNKKYPLISSIMYYLCIKNKYTSWLLISSLKARINTIKRIFKILIN